MNDLDNKIKNEFDGGRPVDKLAKDIESWWGKGLIYVRKSQIKAWKAYALVTFFGGLAVAAIFMVAFNFQLKSNAEANSSALTLFPATVEVNQGETFDVDVSLNTKENNVVAVKAVVDYDTSRFSLQNWDTSGSVFSLNNVCVYQGKACEIVDNDTGNGKITITLAKPTPGIKTASGSLAKLTFKALQAHSASQDGIKVNFVGSGSYADSDVIQDDGIGTDILSQTTSPVITILGPICASIAYTAWGECQPDETHIRSVDVANSQPVGCEPSNPDLMGSCAYTPPACTDYTYSDWGECQPNGTHSRTVIGNIPVLCAGGAAPTTKDTCAYVPPTCASFTYSDWGTCQSNSTQSRTVASSSPAGCSGGNPVISESCKYIPPQVACTSFTYSNWGTCQSNSTQSRTVASSSPAGCSGGNPITTNTCKYVPPTCTSFTYSDWSSCYSGLQIRKVISSSPVGCAGGSLSLVRRCDTYKSNTSTGNIKITDLPSYLSKKPGEKIWWNASSKYGISYYVVSGAGQEFKTINNSFNIPINTPTGFYILKVAAYDKAGNRTSVSSLIRITSW